MLWTWLRWPTHCRHQPLASLWQTHGRATAHSHLLSSPVACHVGGSPRCLGVQIWGFLAASCPHPAAWAPGSRAKVLGSLVPPSRAESRTRSTSQQVYSVAGQPVRYKIENSL